MVYETDMETVHKRNQLLPGKRGLWAGGRRGPEDDDGAGPSWGFAGTDRKITEEFIRFEGRSLGNWSAS